MVIVRLLILSVCLLSLQVDPAEFVSAGVSEGESIAAAVEVDPVMPGAILVPASEWTPDDDGGEDEFTTHVGDDDETEARARVSPLNRAFPRTLTYPSYRPPRSPRLA